MIRRITARGFISTFYVLVALAVLFLCTGCGSASVSAEEELRRNIPSWVEWQRKEITVDLTGDGVPEKITLKDGVAQVEEHGQKSWESSKEWLIQDMWTGDITGDGSIELVALTWVKGRFGTSKPFWQEHDDSIGQHVYIFRYVANPAERDQLGIKQVWMSSTISFEAETGTLDDENILRFTHKSGNHSAWQWQGWGLTLVDGEAF